ncbi:hypothetical protein G3M56_005400 [Sulfuriroseicoccus oceanibius]|uniref:Phospholipase/carboxylesterase/thioesterase domain-containing protein n=1 Tax=Sulfuriroseicoccus oceanibius TaxID=2707525 RepID=A0A6B3LAS6_9BACT|nr:hypothetical protein G3M56_005400 [Sulfuriroseicoccus oceanibius]
MDAEFVKVESGRVWLKLAGGKEVATPFENLSAADQTLVRELYKKAQEKELADQKAAELAAEKKRAAMRERWKPGEVVSCTTKGDHRVTYHVYVPTSFDFDQPPPMIYGFSPSGNGRGILGQLRESAEKAGWIVVGCDKLKNSMGNRELELLLEDEILADVAAEVPHDPERVYLSGASGGAMRCYDIAHRRIDVQFAGIIAFGGWLGGSDYQSRKYPKRMAVAIVNGDKDEGANAWVQSDIEALKRYRWEAKHISFPGGHVVAPPAVIDQAIEWIKQQPLPK